jgi:hypothetical protein
MAMEQSTEAPAETDHHHKLADYLGGLHPTTQAAVLRELELSELRGDALGPSYKVVMNELRRGIRKSGRIVERVGNPSRIFYMPIQPFLISEVPDEPLYATVSRASLNPIWAWVCRDLMPAEAKAYIDTSKQALLADDRASAVVVATVFQDKFVVATKPFLQERKNSSLQRRLSAYGGPPTALNDLRAVLFVLQNRDTLRDIAKMFPTKIKAVDGATVEQVSAMLKTLPPNDGAMLTHALAVVMSQIVPSWEVVRLVASSAKLREPITELVLGRMQAMAATLRMAKWSIDQTGEAASRTGALRAAVEIVRSELRPDEGDPVARRCGQIQDMIDRFERKIAVTKAHMGPRANEPLRVPTDVLRQSNMAQQAAVA